MGLELIHRSLRTSAVVLLICLPFGLYYFGLFATLAFLSGAVWGMMNLILLTGLVRSMLRPGKVDLQRAVVFGVLKFPLLYAAGFFLLKVRHFDPVVLLAGFSLPLLVIVLKAAGRMVLGLDHLPPTPSTDRGGR
ncbi:MAG: hypothetical protein D6800_00965 [Candidatus Zixiibacteriota bacterium]|nr:MAG: hypothetical protein D6800_00965 [candidate division Zixibacteria bacterium]